MANAQPLIATPATGILTVLIMVPALLVGFDVIPQSAEEIDLPQEQIGRLLIFSVVLAVLWYAFISFAVAYALPSYSEGQMATADAAASMWGSATVGQFVVLGGVAGILTSWNAFVVGGSRVLYALARSGHIPAVFARLHPRYKTPYVGIICIGLASCIAPFFGRTILVWLVNAGGFATVMAYLFVPFAFLALRRNRPEMHRPYRVRHPRFIGWSAIVLAFALLSAYLPFSPSALSWPQEWLLIVVWSVLGVIAYATYRRRTPAT